MPYSDVHGMFGQLMVHRHDATACDKARLALRAIVGAESTYVLPNGEALDIFALRDLVDEAWRTVVWEFAVWTLLVMARRVSTVFARQTLWVLGRRVPAEAFVRSPVNREVLVQLEAWTHRVLNP